MLRLDDRWIWDFWLTRDGPDHHAFYLQAPRSLGDPNLRHTHASIGHAVSKDLTRWEVLPDALAPGPPGAWDDLTLWTGSVTAHDGHWHLFYTALSSADSGGPLQRIGAAVSDDLITWQRHPENPLLEADARWYERSADTATSAETWRDPWVFRPPADVDHVALITARSRTWPGGGRGAIAVARSSDLARWEIGPPCYVADDLGELEVPQVVMIEDRWYLVFSVPGNAHGRRWRRPGGQPPGDAVYFLVGEGPTGPFHEPPRVMLTGDGADGLYSGRLIEDGDGGWWCIAARFSSDGGPFIGELTDPMRVDVSSEGALMVDAPGRRRGRTGTPTTRQK